MIEGVLHVVRSHPRSDPDPSAILASLLDGPTLTVGEWAPALGDSGLLSDAINVRAALLSCIERLVVTHSAPLTGNPLLESRLWLAQFDPDKENAETGQRIWAARGHPLSPTYAPPLLVLLGHSCAAVRGASARALAAGMAQLPDTAMATLKRLLELFANNAPKPEVTPHRPTRRR
jgi:hypothetical protein